MFLPHLVPSRHIRRRHLYQQTTHPPRPRRVAQLYRLLAFFQQRQQEQLQLKEICRRRRPPLQLHKVR